MKPRVLVVGVGRPGLGDDALGLEIAGRLRNRLEHVARVISDATTGWEALAAIEDEELLVLIDAAEENQRLPAGHWCRLDYPRATGAIVDCQLRGTHALGLDSMLRMGRTLGRLPSDVWVYAVAGRRFQPETGLSASVATVIDQLAARIEDDVLAWSRTRPSKVGSCGGTSCAVSGGRGRTK